jgi:hypothetical protein
VGLPPGFAFLRHRDFGDIQCPLGMGTNRGISPALASSAAEQWLPGGVGDGFDSAVIATVAPTIVALSRLFTDTTGCPISIVIGSCREPNYSGD